jgi:hypothetical protein
MPCGYGGAAAPRHARRLSARAKRLRRLTGNGSAALPSVQIGSFGCD